MTRSTPSQAKKASSIALVLCVAAVALISLGRPTPSYPALHQQPESISIRFPGPGSDRFLWLSKYGESTSATYSDGKFSGLRSGKFQEAQWSALCNALPATFFSEPDDHWAASTTSKVAYEEYSAGVSVSLNGRYRTVWVHPSHFSHGLLESFSKEVGSASESLPFVDGVEKAFALSLADAGSRVEAPPPALSALLEKAVKNPGRWYSEGSPGNGHYSVNGCGYWLMSGVVHKRSWEHNGSKVEKNRSKS